MTIFLVILGVTLILASVLWLIIFNINKRKIIENYANGRLLEYKDDELVPEKVAKQLISDGIGIVLRKVLINTFVPAIMIFCGVILLLAVFQIFK